MKSLLYGVLLIIACSCLRYSQSTPTFVNEYVHIKLHLPVETRHQGPAAGPHNKVIHHQYHKRRRPVHKYPGAKSNSGANADDYLEALIVSTAKRPQHHHNDEKFSTHVEHYDPVETYIVHDQHSIADLSSLEELGYRKIHDHEDVDFGHQSHYKPQQHVETIKILKSKNPGKKYLPAVSYEDDSNLKTEEIKYHPIENPYHQTEIEEELVLSKSHFRPSPYEATPVKYATHLSSDEDFHYSHKPKETEEFLDIGTIYQTELLKNPAQNFKSHHHKEPTNVVYGHKNPTKDTHQIIEEYLPDYVGKVRQVVEYPIEEGKNEDIIFEHSDFEPYDPLSSHEEHSSHDETSSLITAGGAIVDWPSHESEHHGAETYSGIDSYSDTHVQRVGGGLKHSLHNSKFKN